MSQIYLIEAIEDYLFERAEGILYRHVECGIFLIEYPDGRKIFHHDGKLHRKDGPAVETSTGRKYWYYYGEEIKCSSQIEFERLLKMKAFW
jgi:hypothetical protein